MEKTSSYKFERIVVMGFDQRLACLKRKYESEIDFNDCSSINFRMENVAFMIVEINIIIILEPQKLRCSESNYICIKVVSIFVLWTKNMFAKNYCA